MMKYFLLKNSLKPPVVEPKPLLVGCVVAVDPNKLEPPELIFSSNVHSKREI